MIESLAAGGAERALCSLTAALRARGHHCEVAVLTPPYTLGVDLHRDSVEVHELELTHPWNLPQGVMRLLALIARVRPTVIHSHLFFAGLHVAATRPLSPGPARVATFQNLGYESYPATSAKLRLRKQIDRFAMHHGIDAHIAVSAAVARSYSTHLGLTPIHTIPNGLDIRAVWELVHNDGEPLTSRHASVLGRPLLLCAANFRFEKDHRNLFAAMRIVDGGVFPPHLALAGDGALRAELQDAVSTMGLDDRVHFLGQLDHDDLLHLTAAADAVVLSSTHEGLPVTVVEAMAAGTPVVATAVGGIPEVVEDGRSGLLVPPGDPPALAGAIERILRDGDLRARIAAGGAARVREFCPIEQIAERHEALYDSLVGAGAREVRSAGSAA